MPTREQQAWVAEFLGYDGGPKSATSALDLRGLDPAQQRMVAALQRLAVSGGSGQHGLPPAVQRALAALDDEFSAIEADMRTLLGQLEREELGAIDEAAALLRLSELRSALGRRLDALSAAMA